MAQISHTPDRRTGRALALLILVMVVIGGVAMTLMARSRWWLPPVATVHGLAVDRLFTITLLLTGVVFVAVHVVLALFIWRYAAGGDRPALHWHQHHRLELAWTVVPAVALAILITMGGVVWSQVHRAAPDGALEVEVRAEQFAWLVRYPGPDGAFGRTDPALITRENPMGLDPADPASGDDLLTRELHLVVNRPARIRLRSRDVLHSFFIPEFRVKQDAVPGMTLGTWFVPTREGKYEIACAELCGVGHYIMRGRVTVESQAAFDAWIAGQKR